MTTSAGDLDDALIRALIDAPEGLSSVELQRRARLGSISRSTLSRALTRLLGRGLIRAEGQTRARRYFAATAAPAQPSLAPLAPGSLASSASPPLSDRSRALLRQLKRPLGERAPAGYDRAWLDAYSPGQTPYLDPALTRRLAALGTTAHAADPGGTYARRILERLLIDLSWNSSRLEGNTYSRLDTERLLAGEPVDGKAVHERQMILNHKQAIEWLVTESSSYQITPYVLRSLHAMLAENLLPNHDAGRERTTSVSILGSTFHPLEVPQQIEECLRQIAHTTALIADPFEESFFLLVHVPYLQPFIDVNKRTARLAANIPLIRKNLRPLTFAEVPRDLLIYAHLAVYERRDVSLMRDLYAWAYERSCAQFSAIQQSIGEPDPFRLIHRQLIHETVAALVRARVTDDQLPRALSPFAERLPLAERPRFISVIESELDTLHEGSIARYRLRPAEFAAWVARA